MTDDEDIKEMFGIMQDTIIDAAVDAAIDDNLEYLSSLECQIDNFDDKLD